MIKAARPPGGNPPDLVHRREPSPGVERKHTAVRLVENRYVPNRRQRSGLATGLGVDGAEFLFPAQDHFGGHAPLAFQLGVELLGHIAPELLKDKQVCDQKDTCADSDKL